MANHTLLLLLRNSGLTFLCVFILFNEAFAQPLDGNDQVDSTDFYRQPWIGNNQYLFDYRDWLEGSKSKTSTIAPYGVDQQVYIPVKAWVYRSNTGLGGLSYADVEWYLRKLNEMFTTYNSTGIYFYLVCEPYYINDEEIRNGAGPGKRGWVYSNYRDPYVLNVHFVNDLPDLAGEAVWPWGSSNMGTFVETGESRSTQHANTLAHEAGHCLGLLHTHHGTGTTFNKDAEKCKQEFVSRPALNSFLWCGNNKKKCEEYGDGLCDTEADPGLGLVRLGDQVNNGIYAGVGTDKDSPGQTWDPDVDLIMSYSEWDLRNRFTPMQQAVMLFYSTINTQPFATAEGLVNNQNPDIDIYEPNNTVDFAERLTLNNALQATLHASRYGQPTSNLESNCDQDWYWFAPEYTAKYSMNTRAIAGAPQPDTRISVFHPSDLTTPIAFNDDINGTNQFSQISEIQLNKHVGYLILVESNNTKGHYEISIEDCGADCCYNSLLGTTDQINSATGSFNVAVRVLGVEEYLGNSITVTDKLYFNNSSPLGFGGGGTPLSSSHLEAVICNNSEIVVENGGEIIVGSPPSSQTAKVAFQSGTSLRLKQGGKLKIEDGSQLIVADGANLILEEGAIIELPDDNSVLEIQGKLSVAANADFTFSGNGHLVFDQSVPWSAQGPDLSAYMDIGPGAGFSVQGPVADDDHHLVMEVRQPLYLRDGHNNSFSQLRLEDGTIAVSPGALVYSYSPTTMRHCKITTPNGNGWHGGFRMWHNYGPNIIEDNRFERGSPAFLAQWPGGGDPIKLKRCDFNNNVYGAKVLGGNFTVQDCNFYDHSQEAIVGSQLSGNSVITGSDLNNYTDYGTGIILSSQSGAVVTVSKTNVRNFHEGMSITNSVNVKSLCSVYESNGENGVLVDYAHLYLDNYAGNQFLDNGTIHIRVNTDEQLSAGLYLKDGYNSFYSTSPTCRNYIYSGTPDATFESEYTAGGDLNCNNNEMPLCNQGSPYGNSIPVYIQNNTVGVHIPNNLTDPHLVACNNFAQSPLEHPYSQLMMSISTSGGSVNTGGGYGPLHSAVSDALQNLSYGEYEGEDLHAVNDLQNILNTSISNADVNTPQILDLAYKGMIQGLNNAYQYRLLEHNAGNPEGELPEEMTVAIGIADGLISDLGSIDSLEMYPHFRYQLDKTHLYRLGGYYTQALGLLDVSDSWAHTYAQQERASYWSCVCTAENDYYTGVIGAEAFSEAIQTCNLTHAGYNYKRQSQGSDEQAPVFDYYPQPAGYALTLFMEPSPGRNVSYHIYNVSGQLVQEGKLAWSSREQEVLVHSLTPGLYILSLDLDEPRRLRFMKN